MKNQANLAGVTVGRGAPVRVMGVINLSPESFYKGSVQTTQRALARIAREMMAMGADFIDVGAMSTAPYLTTQIPEEEEAKRLKWAIPIIKDNSDCPISVDTSRLFPAESALKAGAAILNDITGLSLDPRIGALSADFKGFILMAHPSRLKRPSQHPVKAVKTILEMSLRDCAKFKIQMSKVVLDPGVGFFRFHRFPWWKWDMEIIRHLDQLTPLGRPLLLGVSRKSFIGHFLQGRPPEDRLAGSLAVTTVGVLNGASIIRTHDVKETKEAVTLAENFIKD